MMTPDKAFTLLLLSLLFLLASAAGGGGSAEDLIFRGFGGGVSTNLTLTGVAAILPNGALRLTNDNQRVQGHAFYSQPFRLKDSPDGKALSFSAAFAFSIVPEYPKLGGHGLAFVLSPSSSIQNSLPAQYLGLFNSTTASIYGGVENSSISADLPRRRSHLVAVEFDTVQDFGFSDIDDNHVGLDIDGLNSTFSGSASAANVLLKSGRVIQAWINYDSTKSQLTVKLSHLSTEPPKPVLTADIDLSPYVGDSTFVGFSASTGLLASSHYLLGWEFKVNGKVNSLNLSSLPSVPKPNKKRRQRTVGFVVVASMSSFMALALISGLSFYVVKKIKDADVLEPWELDIGPHRFTYDELKKATKGFREKELIGFGGFGKVYKGALRDKNNESVTRVAVKRISHESKQGLREFVSEISIVGRLRHRNLVQLLGWCRRRGDLLLVYDYMENGSLDKLLYGSDQKSTARVLTWGERFEIVKGVARGLLYLHEEWDQAVIHRDVKAGNVLLDSEMNARLGDFGLAKLYERGTNPSTTRVVGTLGYLAPEMTRTGKPTTDSDVFAFGGFLLEVVCGRRPIEPKALPEELILVDWVWDRWRAGVILDVVDPKLNGKFEEGEVVLVVKLGLMCSNDRPEVRPSMRQVMRYLDGEAALLDDVAPPAPPVGGCNEKKGGFEDFLHSYPSSSSVLERASTMSSRFDDFETGSTTPLTILC